VFSDRRITGVLSVFNHINEAVSNFGKQTPPEDIGVDEFEFWCPQRRPEGQNIAMNIEPGLRCFSPDNLVNGVDRPTTQTNAWVADFQDTDPWIRLEWEAAQGIQKIDLYFDTDF